MESFIDDRHAEYFIHKNGYILFKYGFEVADNIKTKNYIIRKVGNKIAVYKIGSDKAVLYNTLKYAYDGSIFKFTHDMTITHDHVMYDTGTISLE